MKKKIDEYYSKQIELLRKLSYVQSVQPIFVKKKLWGLKVKVRAPKGVIFRVDGNYQVLERRKPEKVTFVFDIEDGHLYAEMQDFSSTVIGHCEGFYELYDEWDGYYNEETDEYEDEMPDHLKDLGGVDICNTVCQKAADQFRSKKVNKDAYKFLQIVYETAMKHANAPDAYMMGFDVVTTTPDFEKAKKRQNTLNRKRKRKAKAT